MFMLAPDPSVKLPPLKFRMPGLLPGASVPLIVAVR
jgi:hypothetical protein